MQNIIDYYADSEDPCLGQYIRGHLYLEFALNKIINRAFDNPKELNGISNSFYKKVKLLRSINRITDKMEYLLLEINATRNKLAHNLNFKLDFDRVYELVNLAFSAGVDFSDYSIFNDYCFSQENYGVEGILIELMGNTFSELFYANEDLFPDNEYTKFMC